MLKNNFRSIFNLIICFCFYFYCVVIAAFLFVLREIFLFFFRIFCSFEIYRIKYGLSFNPSNRLVIIYHNHLYTLIKVKKTITMRVVFFLAIECLSKVQKKMAACYPLKYIILSLFNIWFINRYKEGYGKKKRIQLHSPSFIFDSHDILY